MEPKNTLPKVAHHANDAENTSVGSHADATTPVIPGLTRDPVLSTEQLSPAAVIPGLTRDPVLEIPNQMQTKAVQEDATGHNSKRLDPGSATPLRGGPGVRDDSEAETGVRDDKVLPNSAIRYAVTVGHRVSAPNLIEVRDISYVMECVKTGCVEGTDIRVLILTIRNVPNAELARAMKANLPYFLGSVCERVRSNSTVKYANFAIFDLDHVENIEAVKQAAIDKLTFLRWAFRSVRDGVKLVAQFDRPVTREEDYRVLWQYLALQVERALGLKPDATPDWSRACFYSFDPGLLYNSAFKAVDVASALKEAEWVQSLGGMVEWWKGGKDAAQSSDSSVAVHETTNLSTVSPLHLYTSSDDFSKARSVVSQLAQLRIDYRDWIRVGMALYAGFGEGGKPLWDLFLGNPQYPQETQKDLDHHWRSFRKVHTLSLATLFYLGERYGCV